MSLKLLIPPWLTLGFYRGVNQYNYKYKKDKIEYEKNKKSYKNPQYLYSSCFGDGLFGLFIYSNPFFIPPMFALEIYRIEVNLRGLEKDDKYYKIL